MAGQQADTFEVENPYTYWRTAQEYEQSGDARGAEIGYKAAVIAADNLPLTEYRRNFQQELSKHLSTPGYRTPPDVGPEELKTAYAELLTLPYAARVRLAMFFNRQNMTAEASEMCTAALNLRIDDWVICQELYLDLKQQLENTVRNLHRRPSPAPAPAPPQETRVGQPLIGRQAVKTQPLPPPYSLPDITEMWNAHITAQSSQPAATGPNAASPEAQGADEPLSMEFTQLVEAMYTCLKTFTDNITAAERKSLAISISTPEFNEAMVRTTDAFGGEQLRPQKFYRFRAGTSLTTVSVRGCQNSVEIFVVPAHEVLKLSEAESDYSRRWQCLRADVSGRTLWTCDRHPLYSDDLRVTVRNTFKEVLQQTSEFSGAAPMQPANSDTQRLMKQVSELSQQRTNLAEKIVYQQEIVQNRIARDIHDSVIADLLALKRSFEAHTAGDAEVVSAIEDVSQRLRNICSDLAPRDLQDWGLRTVLTDMVTSVSQRLHIVGETNIVSDLPELPYQVSLHIYRIVQECLNNMEKHSHCKRLNVNLTVDDGVLVVSVQDDGVGFDQTKKDARKAAQGGMGLDSIRERVELIRCFFPAQFWIQSQPGAGTKFVMQININPSR